jgi:hypothetical protein
LNRTDPTTRFRLLGILPLSFFIVHFLYYLSHGRAAEILWLCHVSNFILSVGLLFNIPFLVRLAVIWLAPGLLLWLMEIMKTGDVSITSSISHIGGLIVGLLAMARVGAGRNVWLYAFVWGLFIQISCRLITPVSLNVNVAHRIYDGWEDYFTGYWQYWLCNSLLAAAYLWFTGAFLIKLFPQKTYTGIYSLATEIKETL